MIVASFCILACEESSIFFSHACQNARHDLEYCYVQNSNISEMKWITGRIWNKVLHLFFSSFLSVGYHKADGFAFDPSPSCLFN